MNHPEETADARSESHLVESDSDSVPPLFSKWDRINWLERQIASNAYAESDKEAFQAECCRVWGLAPSTVRKLISDAAGRVENLTNSRETLRKLCTTRLNQVAEEHDPRDRVAANMALLKSIGAFGDAVNEARKHGTAQQVNPADPEAKKRMVSAMANPNNQMSVLIEAALIKAKGRDLQLDRLVRKVYGLPVDSLGPKVAPVLTSGGAKE